MPDDNPPYQLLLQNQIKLYFHVACACAWICDYICGIPDEQSLIWGTPWKPPKVLYLLTRYLPFMSLGINVYYSFTTYDGVTECVRLQKVISAFTVSSMFFADLTFTIRTWAVWKPYHKSAVFIPILFMGVWASRITMLSFWLSAIRETALSNLGIRGCHVAPMSPLILPFNIVFAIYVGILFGLMSLKAYNTYGNIAMTPGFYKVVYLDGSLYYLYLFILSLTDLILNLKLGTLKNLISMLQQFTFSMLACRLLLHLRRLHPADPSYFEQTFGFLTTLETESELSEELNPHPEMHEY